MSTHRHRVRSGARSKRAAIAAIAEALSFPAWFGQNLDALYDALTDLSWLPEGELTGHLETATADDAVRVVVLSHTG
ncbi:barstar family protein, partial [Saccharothrix sp. MB29]|nr:barstar family protein [Saccharothrix sp. MB29]